MKLILTEQQLNNVLINEKMEYLVLESLNESLNFKALIKTSDHMIITIYFILTYHSFKSHYFISIIIFIFINIFACL